MRFSACYKLVQLSGFFWGQYFLPYGVRWTGWGGRLGQSRMLRQYALALQDGGWPSGFVARSPLRKNRTRNLGLWLLHYTTPFIPAFVPAAWRLLLYVRIRSYRGLRALGGLPTQGQRTHSNASTPSKLRDPASAHLVGEGWARLFGFHGARAGASLRKKARPRKAQASKGAKKPAVRSKKKADVWR